MTIAAYYQVAVWELLYERQNATSSFNLWNVAGGTAYFSDASLMAGAQDLIKNIDATSPYYQYAGLLETANPPGTPYAQDFLAPVPDGGTTLLLLGGALMGLGALRRKFGA